MTPYNSPSGANGDVLLKRTFKRFYYERLNCTKVANRKAKRFS